MHTIRRGRLGSRLPLALLSAQAHRHPAVARALLAGLALAVAAAISFEGAAQAGLTVVPPAPQSILPVNVGVGIGTQALVTLEFPQEMDRASVEAALTITPADDLRLAWTTDGRALVVSPAGRWRTDQRYALVVGAAARAASGALLASPVRFSFTTQSAPRIAGFDLQSLAAPPLRATAMGKADEESNLAAQVSARTAIRLRFSTAMNRAEVEAGFLLSPAVPGIFSWTGPVLSFTPIERLAADARYAVSVTGAHDLAGNPISGDTSFSFTTRAAAHVVQSTPAAGATRVRDGEVVLLFSQPVDPTAVGTALRVGDATTGKTLTGTITWNAEATQLRFTPTRAFAAGHRIVVSLADGAVDADGNAVTASLTFTMRATPRPAVTGPQGSGSLVTYALNQLNAARAARGLAPLAYSTAIEAVALSHAWDEVTYNYFSHTGRDGSSHEDRLRRAGLTFGWNGENQCMNNSTGRTPTQTLDWCQAQLMSEPYPGYANHIGNILSTHYTKVGIGIAIQGAKVVVVWDFTD